MKKLIAFLFALIVCYCNLVACSCSFSGPFFKVAGQSDLVIIGDIAEKGNGTLEVSIDQVLRGNYELKTIEINGDKTGDSCYEVLKPYQVGQRFAFALKLLKGKYYLENCGEYKVKIENELVKGMVNKKYMEDPSAYWPKYNNKTMPLEELISYFGAMGDISAPCIVTNHYEKSEDEAKALMEAKAKEGKLEDYQIYQAASKNYVLLFEYYSQDKDLLKTEGYKKAVAGAANSGNIDIVKAAINHGYDVDSHPLYGRPLLSEGAKYPEIVKYLLQNGADPNEKGSNDLTGIMTASAEGCLSCIKMLKEAGADLSMKSIHGYDAMKFTKKFNDINSAEVIALLKSYQK